MTQFSTGLPGIRADRTASYRRVRLTDTGRILLPTGLVVSGSASRDTGNTGDLDVLRPGKVMGRITSGGKYAPSCYGVTGGALTSSGTSLTIPAAVSTELARRVGATGTFKLTGPPTSAGTVRTMTATYSALGATTATITALGVNEVQTLNWTNSPSGTFRLIVVDSAGVAQVTQPITYSATPATLVSNINTALDAALGAGLVVASGAAVTAIAITFSGAGYAALPQTLIEIDTDALTAGDVDITRTTTGVDGRFVTGSWIQPTDGSESPLGLIDDGYGIKVTDQDGVSEDQPIELLIGGVVDSSQIIDWPADTSLRAWLVAQLKLNGIWAFDHLLSD